SVERRGALEVRQQVRELRGELAVGGHGGLEFGELLVGGEFAADHEVPDLLEGAVLGEVDGVVLAVVVEALFASDVADLGVGDDDAIKASGTVEEFGHRSSRPGRSLRAVSGHGLVQTGSTPKGIASDTVRHRAM